MLVISSTEFSHNQNHYLDLIDKNERVIIRRDKDKYYIISTLDSSDPLLAEIEFFHNIGNSIQQAKNRRITKLS